jgi:hypothetical protein
VRIKLAQHASDGIFYQLLLVYIVYVEIADRYLSDIQLAQRRIVTIIDAKLSIGTKCAKAQQYRE